MTRPSPPLFPFPQKTVTDFPRSGENLFSMIAAARAPAFSIRTIPGIPSLLIAIRSHSRISRAVTRGSTGRRESVNSVDDSQHRGRIDPETDNQEGRKGEGGEAHTGHGDRFGLGSVPKIHDHDESEIVIDRDETCDDPEDRQPGEIRLNSGHEDIIFREEAGHRWYTGEREHENGHKRGQERPSSGQACIILERKILLLLTLQNSEHTEGAEIHERVDDQVKQNSVPAGLAEGSEPSDHVSGMSDARVGEHPLDIRL